MWRGALTANQALWPIAAVFCGGVCGAAGGVFRKYFAIHQLYKPGASSLSFTL